MQMPKGAMPRGNAGSRAAEVAAKKPQMNFKTIKRLMGMIFSKYKARLVLVGICIIISSVVTVLSSVFIQTIVDDFIEPLLLKKQTNPGVTVDLAEFAKLISKMIVIYVFGTIAMFTYNRLMKSSTFAPPISSYMTNIKRDFPSIKFH